MSGCGTRIVLRGQKLLALCDRCPCFGSLFPPLAALTFAASSIICAFGLASAAPRSPYRHLELCGIALNRFGLNREKLLGVGIALPAIFNTDRTCVVTAPTLNLRDQSIRPLICSIPYPVSVCNDATSGGYAEWYVQQDSDCMAYISLEGGVGGAILMNGVPYTGLNGRSGEFGHICVQPEGLSCKCGLRGCLEAYCSSDRISTDLGISVEQFFAGLEAGNLAYQTLWKDYLNHLASALATIRMVFDCRIVLGGYIAQYLTPFLKELRGLTASRDPFDEEAEYISLCHYLKHAVPLGAALHFINLFVEEL